MMLVNQDDQKKAFLALLDKAIESPRPALLNQIAKIAKTIGIPREQVRAWIIMRQPWQPTRKVKCDYDHKSARIPCALAAL